MCVPVPGFSPSGDSCHMEVSQSQPGKEYLRVLCWPSQQEIHKETLSISGDCVLLFSSELSGIFLAHCQLCLPTNPRMFPKPCIGIVNCGGQCVLLPLSFIPEDYIIEKSLHLCRSV